MRDTTVPRFNPPVEPARTVGFGKRDSARTVGFGKRVSARTVGFGKRDSKNGREREIGCGIGDGESKDQGEEGILYINSLRPSVRLSDAAVLRFNSPAELACIFYGRTGPAGELKCKGRFSSPTLLLLRRLSSPFAICDHWTQRKVTGKR